MVETGVQAGALVRLHTDGHIGYFLPKDAVKPSGGQRDPLASAERVAHLAEVTVVADHVVGSRRDAVVARRCRRR